MYGLYCTICVRAYVVRYRRTPDGCRPYCLDDDEWFKCWSSSCCQTPVAGRPSRDADRNYLFWDKVDQNMENCSYQIQCFQDESRLFVSTFYSPLAEAQDEAGSVDISQRWNLGSLEDGMEARATETRPVKLQGTKEVKCGSNSVPGPPPPQNGLSRWKSVELALLRGTLPHCGGIPVTSCPPFSSNF